MSPQTPSSVPALEIPEIQATDVTQAEFAERYFKARVPAVVKGAARAWDFMRTWSNEYLAEVAGDHRCSFSHDSRPARAKDSCSLREYLTAHSDASTLTYTPFKQDPLASPGLLRDIPFPNPFFSRGEIVGFAFFHAHDNAGTLPHVHSDSFNLLQKGTKRWAIFDAAPDTAPDGWRMLKRHLKEYPEGSQASLWFGQGLEEVRREGVAVYEFRQDAGDIVYVPEYFSHAVLNLSEVQGLVVQVDRVPAREFQPLAVEEVFGREGAAMAAHRHGL